MFGRQCCGADKCHIQMNKMPLANKHKLRLLMIDNFEVCELNVEISAHNGRSWC